jgi:hypothetical protein
MRGRRVLSVLCTLDHEAPQSVHKKPCRIRPGLRELPRILSPRSTNVALCRSLRRAVAYSVCLYAPVCINRCCDKVSKAHAYSGFRVIDGSRTFRLGSTTPLARTASLGFTFLWLAPIIWVSHYRWLAAPGGWISLVRHMDVSSQDLHYQRTPPSVPASFKNSLVPAAPAYRPAFKIVEDAGT